MQVLLWNLGDHVSTLADGTAGSFDGAETRVAARTVLKVSTRDLLCIVFLGALLAEMAAAQFLGQGIPVCYHGPYIAADADVSV